MKKVAFSKNKTWLIDRGSRTKMKKALKNKCTKQMPFYALNSMV